MDADAVTCTTARIGALLSVLTRVASVGGMYLSYANTTDAFGFVKLTPRYCGVLPTVLKLQLPVQCFGGYGRSARSAVVLR